MPLVSDGSEKILTWGILALEPGVFNIYGVTSV